MIELRVLVWPSGQEVLQFRTQTKYVGDSAMYFQWGEWQNVPKVDYRAAALASPSAAPSASTTKEK